MSTPPFIPSFGTIPAIDRAVQIGRGVAGAVLGQTYDVYRLSAATTQTGIISPSSLLYASVPAMFERLTSKADVEIESFVKTLFFTAKVNMTAFLPGDVFVQRSDTYLPDRGVFTCVASRPMPHVPVFVSTPIYATLTRPESNPNHIDAGIAPQSVPIAAAEWPLTITTGSPYPYSFQQIGQPATVPIGMAMQRAREYPKSDSMDGELYDDVRRSVFDVFIPLLPGQPIITRDIITGSNGDRYEITGIQTSTASFFGQLVTAQRIRS